MAAKSAWKSVPCKINQLRLDIVLTAGQSFRWRKTVNDEWIGVLKGRVWTLKQDENNIYYKVSGGKSSSNGKTSVRINKKSVKNYLSTYKDMVEENESILRDYFQLDVDLLKLYSKWCNADPYFSKIASVFPGVRALRQDPVENLFSFICSSNNNISRITGMVERLCELYGEKIADIDGVSYHSFPTVKVLSNGTVEQQLRQQGFGYRAKFILQSARFIQDKGLDWLHGLRSVPYNQAHQELLKLPGVGAKVADCVCLMSLDKTNAVPVDTHVWQVTAKYYVQNLSKTKSLTDKLYKQIGEYYQQLFGDYAGWAQFVLFSADLKKFQNMLAETSTKDESHKRPLPNPQDATGKHKRKKLE